MCKKIVGTRDYGPSTGVGTHINYLALNPDTFVRNKYVRARIVLLGTFTFPPLQIPVPSGFLGRPVRMRKVGFADLPARVTGGDFDNMPTERTKPPGQLAPPDDAMYRGGSLAEHLPHQGAS
jgi:hypothetical protein